MSWSPLDLASMAKKANMEALYFPGYFYPTLQTHATPISLMSRLKPRPGGVISFDEASQRDWSDKALIAAHDIVIRVMLVQNKYFDLNLDHELETRKNDFIAIWGDKSEES